MSKRTEYGNVVDGALSPDLRDEMASLATEAEGLDAALESWCERAYRVLAAASREQEAAGVNSDDYPDAWDECLFTQVAGAVPNLAAHFYVMLDGSEPTRVPGWYLAASIMETGE